MSEPFARAISIDYSDDELDAISEAFTRRDIARRDRDADTFDPIRRAQNQTALRGLVARRAVTLGGTAARPRMTFLEPHATLLGAFLGAQAIATIRHERGATVRAVSFFAHGDVVVEQAAREGMAVQRMTAHGRQSAGALLSAEISCLTSARGNATGDVQLTRRMMSLAVAAVENGEASPDSVPTAAVEILHARLASGSVVVTGRDRTGTRTAEKWAWIDSGDLGLWRVRSQKDTPIIALTAERGRLLSSEILDAWSERREIAASPSPAGL